MKAVQAGFIEIKTSKFTKKVRPIAVYCVQEQRFNGGVYS